MPRLVQSASGRYLSTPSSAIWTAVSRSRSLTSSSFSRRKPRSRLAVADRRSSRSAGGIFRGPSSAEPSTRRLRSAAASAYAS
eukprot:4947233-Lingulodinium_polyedra.AAC.1